MDLFAPPDERLVRTGIAVFGVLGVALSAGRALWFRARYGKRPVAPPRDRRERRWHLAFSLVMSSVAVLVTFRWWGAPWSGAALPVRSLESVLGVWVSIAASVAGFGSALVAQSQMGASWRVGVPAEATALVTKGLYSRVRNPIYTGFLVATGGLVALVPSALSLGILAASIAIIRAWVSIEEARQLEVHGEEFRRYCARTGRFFPRLSPVRG